MSATYAKVGGGESIGGGHGGRGGRVRVEGVDVGEQRRHDGRHARRHVLGRQAREVPASTRKKQLLLFPQRFHRVEGFPFGQKIKLLVHVLGCIVGELSCDQQSTSEVVFSTQVFEVQLVFNNVDESSNTTFTEN